MDAFLERERDLQGGLERETDGAASGELTFFRQSGAFANEDGRAISKGGSGQFIAKSLTAYFC